MALRLPGCHLPGLSADQLTLRGNLLLSDGFTATGEVRLVDAHIGGNLDLSGATLTNPTGPRWTLTGSPSTRTYSAGRGSRRTGR